MGPFLGGGLIKLGCNICMLIVEGFPPIVHEVCCDNLGFF